MCAKRKTAEKKKVLYSDEFYSDISANEMLHAIIVRSPFSYGRIISIELEPNTKLPEGYHLFTFKDVPKDNKIDILGTQIPAFCAGEIEYKGQCVALLAGEDKEVLNELKEKIRITLDKSILKEAESHFSGSHNKLLVSPKDGETIEPGLTSRAAPFDDFFEQNDIIAKRKIITGDTKAIFDDKEEAAFIVEGKWEQKISLPSDKETEGVFCCMKAGNLHIFTPGRWISQIRQTVASLTGFPQEKIIITRTKNSSLAQVNLWQKGIIAAQAALAVIKTGKAVRLSLSRKEQEEIIEFSPDIKISHKTALDQNGTITAMDVTIDFDSGAYNPFASDILDILCIAACGVYNCKNVSIRARAYKSHNPPASPKIGTIDSYAFFAVENQIQKISGETGFSPVDIRQMNKAGGLQKSTKPYTFYFGRASDAINAVAIRSDFKRKYTVSRLDNRSLGEDQSSFAPRMRGLGLSCAFEGAGHISRSFGKSNIYMQVTVTEDKKLVVHAIPSSNAIRENWIKIITDNIEIEKKAIIFDADESEAANKKSLFPITIPDDFIGNSSIRTILLQKCMDSLKRRKWDEAPFTIKKTLYTQRKKIWDQEEFSGTPYYNTAFGTCTVELEIDPCTLRENLSRICVIIDGGKILNPKAAENAVNCSIQSCLASLVTGDRLSCKKISVQFMQSEDEPKQIGNLVYSLLPAAYTAALSQALAVQVSSLPLKTDTLYWLSRTNENTRKTESEEVK